MKKILYKFLKRTAKHYLKRHKPYIIGITGSMGKTTCRTIVTQVLQKQLPHLRISTSPKNFNTEIGMTLAILEITRWSTNPLSIIRTVFLALSKSIFASRKYDVLVLEYGIDHPGDMDYLLSIAKPHIGIFTGLDKVHAEYFEDMDQLLKEKMKLLLHAKELVLTPESLGYTRETLEQIEIDQLTYALRDDEHADIYFTNHKLLLDKNKNTVFARFNLMQGLESIGTVETNLLGQHEAGYIALAIELGMIVRRRISSPPIPPLLSVPPLSSLGERGKLSHQVFSLKEKGSNQLDYHFQFEQQAGRFSIFEGKFGSVLVDSTYNAGPKSMSTVIDMLIKLRREIYPDFDLIYCLGDMRELGDFSEQEHRKIASQVAQSADAVYLIGKWMTTVMYDELEKLGYNMNNVVSFVEIDKVDKVEKIDEVDLSIGKNCYIGNSKVLGEKLLEDIQKREHRSLILFKGSQNTIFLEEAIKVLLRHESDKEKLCRQDTFWKKMKHGY